MFPRHKDHSYAPHRRCVGHSLPVALNPTNQDHDLRLALFEFYRDEMDAIEVDFRRPHDLTDDDPRRVAVEEILAKYGDPPPSAPSPPGWRGRVPSEWDGTLNSIGDCLQEALSQQSVEDIFVGGGNVGLAYFRPVIGFARCALQYIGVSDMPAVSSRIVDVPVAVRHIQELLRFVESKIKEGWKRPHRIQTDGRERKVETKQDSRRSRSQAEVNRLVSGYLVEHDDLIRAARSGNPGALKQVKMVLGRNAIARKLQIRSFSMVGKSPAWIAVADELEMDRKSRRGMGVHRQKIGFDKAVEDKSEAGESAADEAVRRETILVIRKGLAGKKHQKAAEALILGLERRTVTPDDALETMNEYLDQCKEYKSRH